MDTCCQIYSKQPLLYECRLCMEMHAHTIVFPCRSRLPNFWGGFIGTKAFPKPRYILSLLLNHSKLLSLHRRKLASLTWLALDKSVLAVSYQVIILQIFNIDYLIICFGSFVDIRVNLHIRLIFLYSR